ncbi:UTP--glucose-1-phosphate uridylyltransferase [Acholeplasma oculi]|uniref:UTP--glucose-1-phosphate uridylyltransferase n=1 Tax=Acholeplasma oculi TaxID=35623 RepID=A0A061AAZ4_9MOLU|nr:UTP--glucose-1-phosphate uridylyltransferase [Acholeplasma oculi]CDR31018.1 UTP--glucose-1-phosphate uridylyltransferase [Acholeplasma oculi]SKC36405.1 UTP--glucose-1-phosphate uridylyltransferase [Acholeplasma oculi]SUT90496.1 UTP--glucose-1-phosphate uridylyltransferase [Acholeplasma oculi]
MIKKAVIPAAGWGTRFLPITKAVPKEMLPIIDKPALSYIVEEAVNSGIEEILIIISSNKGAIQSYFENNVELEMFLKEKNKLEDIKLMKSTNYGIKIFYTNQEEQLGLGHAVLQAEKFINGEPFAVLLGDDVYVSKEKPALKQLIDAYNEKKSSILGTLEVPDSDTKLYGICIPSDDSQKPIFKLKGVVEKPQEKAPSNSAISGRYILTPQIFDLLKNQKRGAGNEIQLTDSILRLMDTEDVFSLDMTGKRYDIGSKLGYIEAIIDFSLERDDLKDSVRNLLKKYK